MAYQIIVKKRFTKKIEKLLNYLEAEWGKAVADNFLKEIDKRIDTLSEHPFIGAPEIKSAPSILVTKHNRLSIEGTATIILIEEMGIINPNQKFQKLN